MSNPIKFSLCVLFFLLASGCSSVVKLDVRHAPEIDLGAAHTVTVRDFSVSGQVALDVGRDRNVVRGMLKRSLAGSLAAPSDLNVQRQHHAALVEALVQNGHFRVSDGMGDVTLTGHVSYGVKDSLSEKEWKDKKTGEEKERYTLTRTTTAEVNFQATDARGMVLGAARLSDSLERKWEGESAQEARKQAEGQSVEDDVIKVVTATASPLVRKIAPYFVQESRTLEDGKSKQIARGNEAAEAGRWEEAARLWQPLLDSEEAKDRNAALYNLSVYDEYAGRLKAALQKLDRLYADTRERKFSQEADRMRQRIEETRQLRENERARRAVMPN